jgi:hypothetical protein
VVLWDLTKGVNESKNDIVQETAFTQQSTEKNLDAAQLAQRSAKMLLKTDRHSEAMCIKSGKAAILAPTLSYDPRDNTR